MMIKKQYEQYFKGKSHQQIIEERDSYIARERLRQEQLVHQEKLNNKEVLLEQNRAKSMVENFTINPNADNRLYYFRFIFKGQKYYKVGITSQTLKQRYGKEYDKIDKILYDELIDGAIKMEQKIKLKFQNDIFPLKYFNDGGHTEIFDRDVLELDINE